MKQLIFIMLLAVNISAMAKVDSATTCGDSAILGIYLYLSDTAALDTKMFTGMSITYKYTSFVFDSLIKCSKVWYCVRVHAKYTAPQTGWTPVMSFNDIPSQLKGVTNLICKDRMYPLIMSATKISGTASKTTFKVILSEKIKGVEFRDDSGRYAVGYPFSVVVLVNADWHDYFELPQGLYTCSSRYLTDSVFTINVASSGALCVKFTTMYNADSSGNPTLSYFTPVKVSGMSTTPVLSNATRVNSVVATHKVMLSHRILISGIDVSGRRAVCNFKRW